MKKFLVLMMCAGALVANSQLKEYKKGCDNKNGESCLELGHLYDKGNGVKQDYKKANEYYKLGCNLKDGASCFGLGFLYHEGKGVRQDKIKAKNYFGLACDEGSQGGCDNYKELNKPWNLF